LASQVGLEPTIPAPNANAMPMCYHVLHRFNMTTQILLALFSALFHITKPVRLFPGSQFFKPLRLLLCDITLDFTSNVPNTLSP